MGYWCGAHPAEKKVEDSKFKVCQGALTPLPKEYDKDSFIRKVINSITPVPQGIRFQKIVHPDSGFIYVIEVALSAYRPHQLNDGVFYMRNDGQTNKAPYHFTEALFKRINYPNLAVKIKILEHKFIRRSKGRRVALIGEGGVEQYAPPRGRQALRVTFLIVFENLSMYLNAIEPKLSCYINGTVKHKVEEQRVLHYGEPIIEKFQVDFYIAKIDKAELTLTFGSEKSPLKTSKYFVHYNKNSRANQNSVDPTLEILSLNKFIFESK